MKILFVTPPPYMPNRLHRNRSFDLIRILAKKHKVYLLSITTEKKEPEEFADIKKVCKSVRIVYINHLKAIFNCLRFPFLPSEVGYCYSSKATKEIQKIIQRENIDIVYLKRLRSAIYLCDSTNSTSKESRSLPRHLRGDYNRMILDSTDAMSMFYFRLYKQARFPKKLFYLLEALRYKWLEREIAKKIKNWIICSEVDKDYLQRLRGNINIHVVPNAVDTNFFSPRRNPTNVANFSPSRWPKDSSKVELRGGQGNSLLFRGLMDKPVNIDACLFFVKEILPKVHQNIKDIKLFIVGPNPPRLIQKLHNGKDIFVTGLVKDVREYLEKTSVSVCPVRIGAGIRHKILQAWAIGRPVVSTEIGAEGLLYKNDYNIAIANTPQEFAEKIIRLLQDKKYYSKLQRNGLKSASDHSFERVGEKLERVVNYVYKKK